MFCFILTEHSSYTLRDKRCPHYINNYFNFCCLFHLIFFTSNFKNYSDYFIKNFITCCCRLCIFGCLKSDEEYKRLLPTGPNHLYFMSIIKKTVLFSRKKLFELSVHMFIHRNHFFLIKKEIYQRKYQNIPNYLTPSDPDHWFYCL